MYKFEIDKKNYEIPDFKDVPNGVLRKTRHVKDDMDRSFAILEEVLGLESETLAAVDSLSIVEFGEWLSGWLQGAKLGESKDS